MFHHYLYPFLVNVLLSTRYRVGPHQFPGHAHRQHQHLRYQELYNYRINLTGLYNIGFN